MMVTLTLINYLFEIYSKLYLLLVNLWNTFKINTDNN